MGWKMKYCCTRSCRSLLVLGAVWFIYDFLVNIGRGFSLQVFYDVPIGFLKRYIYQ